MTFLLIQIFSCLLAAALIGAVAAWFLRQKLARRREKIVLKDWRDRLRHLELERDRIVQRLSGQVEKLSASGSTGDADPAVLTEYDNLITMLEERVAEREGAIAGQRSEIHDLRASLAEAQNAAQEIETNLQREVDALPGREALEERQRHIAMLEDTIRQKDEAHTELSGRLTDTQSEASDRDRRIEILENAVRQKDEELIELNGKLADAQAQEDERERALRDRHEKEMMALRIELDQASRDSDTTQAGARTEQLEEAIRQRDDSIAVLRDDLAELTEQRKIESRGRQDEQLRTAIEDAAAWQTKYDKAAELLEARDLRIAELEAGPDDAYAAPAPGTVKRKAKHRRKKPSRTAAAQPRSGGERIGSLLARPPGPRDNLQEIRGIGPMLEKMLNELGIFHFHQIAAFGAADIARISREIGRFGNRIERDDWITQAGELHRKHHG